MRTGRSVGRSLESDAGGRTKRSVVSGRLVSHKVGLMSYDRSTLSKMADKMAATVTWLPRRQTPNKNTDVDDCRKEKETRTTANRHATFSTEHCNCF